MLKVGPYPWSVKQRVMGRKEHLSEHNNHREIVRVIASQALEQRSLAARLIVAEPGKRSEVFRLG